jgi:hypothetical protein
VAQPGSIPVGRTLPAIKPGSQAGGAEAFRLIPLTTVKRKPLPIAATTPAADWSNGARGFRSTFCRWLAVGANL